MPKVWPIVLGLIIFILVIGMALIVYARENRAPSEEELPSGIVLNNTRDLPEVKAFLVKYPDANVSIDRSGRLAVDYSVRNEQVSLNISGTEVYPSLRLRILMTQEGEPQEMFVACRDTNNDYERVETDIIGYLQTEKCLGYSNATDFYT